jgi:putative CocE/NonD family hydrolase
VPRARKAAERVRKTADIHARPRVVAVHLLRVRRKDGVGTGLSAELEVGHEGARILLIVLVRSELRGVDEETYDDAVVLTAGAFDQRKMETRPDILVYTSEPFKEGTEVSGPITPTLYVSSDAKDTDFTVKVIDVYPDGRAYNLDESIQRMRYRNGYDKPLAWMEPGKVYKVTLQPLTTSNYFEAGHRLRIEVSSSNFPRFDRNLNTGGNNYDEAKGVVAHNAVHHSKQHPSQVTITVVRR